MRSFRGAMDRAQRRQRRLDQKTWRRETVGRGRGKPKNQVPEASNRESADHPEIMGGGQNASEGESTDDVTIYEGGTEDLQLKLHMADADGRKWKKIADERFTEIEILKLKIKEISAEKTVRQGQSNASETLKLKSEMQLLEDKIKVLEEKNSELLGTLNRLFKLVSPAMEILRHVHLDTISNQQTSPHDASKKMWNSGRNGHESTTEVNACVENQTNGRHLARTSTEHLARNVYGNAPEGIPEGHHQPGKKSGSSAISGFNSGAEVDIDGLGVQKSGHEQLRREEVHNPLGENPTSEGDGCGKHYDSGRPQQSPNDGTAMKDVPAILFTAAERKKALGIVEMEFVMWLNSRVRRPTATEMTFHKSKLLERPRSLGTDSFYWSGISGNVLLKKFAEETGMSKPTPNSLTNLLRSILRIESAKTTNDITWCLVWADCTHLEQLPGNNGTVPHELKRGRPLEPEDPARNAKTKRP